MMTKILCFGLLIVMGIIIVCLIIKISKLKARNELLSEENHKIFQALDRNRNAFSEAVQVLAQAIDRKNRKENKE